MSKITFAIGAAALATLASLSAPAQAQYYGPHNAPRVVVVPAPPPPPHAYGYHGRPRWDDRRDYRHSHRRGPWGDRDRDGVPNRYDRDRDNDGVPNRWDRAPGNPYRY